jgi:hypothetical protein
MNWTHSTPAVALTNLENPVEKTGASESVAIVAIIWGIAIIVAGTNS